MSQDVTPLFTPLKVGPKCLRNRIVMPPMVVNRDLTAAEGQEWYGQRARGGVGLVIVEATGTARYGAEYVGDNLRPLVEAIHGGGAMASVQLYPRRRGQSVSPADLTAEEVRQLVAQYCTATEVCAAAGFDGVEPHGAHGYLLNQFFSPQRNKRSDEYGGTLAGRSRLALEIVQAIRPILDDAGMLLLYRHTPIGPGYGIEESLALARDLVAAGVDVLDISPASDAAPGDRAAPFSGLGVPVIAVNELDDVHRSLEVLREGRATLVAIGRGLIADPEWPTKVREGRTDEIVACIRCDDCHHDLRNGVHVRCSQWE